MIARIGGHKIEVKDERVMRGVGGAAMKPDSPGNRNSPKQADPAASPYRSKLEEAYSRYLQGLLLAGDIERWSYEPIRLNLAVKTTLTPDFLVITKVGAFELHEVKGWAREDAMVKLKIAARLYPYWKFVLVNRFRGVWNLRELPT